MEERVPPQDLEAEQSVLGAMMLSKEAFALVIGKLKAVYFYKEAHAHIFEAMQTLSQKGEPIDLITLADELKKKDVLEMAGGRTYLAEVLNSVPTAANCETYADIISEKAILRQLIEAGTEIVQSAFRGSDEVDELLGEAQKTILSVSRERIRDDFVILKDILMPVMDNIEKVYENENKILGVSTGFGDLDQMTSGFQKSDLIILAARPAMGKTTLALNMALQAAHQGHAVAVFSSEMPKEQIALRLLSSESKIDSARIRTANMQDHEYRDLSRALGKLSEVPLYVDDTPSISPLELRAKSRRLQMEVELKLIVVDYLQLMRLGRKRIESRFQEVSEIVRELKAFARELNVPIMALSQLSRDVEKRQDSLPKLSDLRESGEIEQTADLVMFIHREDYYDPAAASTSQTKLMIAKQRNGPTGSIDMVFKKDISRFYPAEKKHAAAPTF